QNCNSIERVYVQESIWTRFLDLLTGKMKRIRVGNGMDPGTDMGPLASAEQLHKVESIVRHAEKQGAELLLGGRRVAGLDGHFFEPTLLHWPKNMQAPFQEEIFGPLIMVTPFSSDEEAIRLANHSPFGLAASVWTENRRRGEALARSIQSGTVMINDSVVSFGMPEAGWTGVKMSGVGWVHGEKGLDEMVNIKYVNRDPMSRTQKFWWFPYTAATAQALQSGMAFLYGTGVMKKIRLIPGILRYFAGYLAVNRGKKDKW
ncbi:aldehyde dehydrogenase family protein, partial [bacterium]|nr:aldehyde dehydrogenase family protein [bacterium]